MSTTSQARWLRTHVVMAHAQCILGYAPAAHQTFNGHVNYGKWTLHFSVCLSLCFCFSSANEQQFCTLPHLSLFACLSFSFSPSQPSISFPLLPTCLVLFSIIISSPPAQLQTLWLEICIPRMERAWGRQRRKERERESWTEKEGRWLKEAIVPL